MIDFSKLDSDTPEARPLNPEEIFKELPKPHGVNDLFSGQAEIIREYFSRKDEKDLIVKLNTGGGKTLVGLLIAQSVTNRVSEPALYLVENKQLASQVHATATGFGIRAALYENASSIDADFLNGEKILIGTYKALFNGKTCFGLEGSCKPINLGCLILDDAHASIQTIRDSFSLRISAEDFTAEYKEIALQFRDSFMAIDKASTFDDFLEGKGSSGIQVLEVPFWDWVKKSEAVREAVSELHARIVGEGAVSNSATSIMFAWPLVKDYFKYSRMLLSQNGITITPYLPLLNLFPSFASAGQRIYMSATFADDSALIETFGLAENVIRNPLVSGSLAGNGNRLILMYEEGYGDKEQLSHLLKEVVNSKKGAVVLTPSNSMANSWAFSGVEVVLGNSVNQAIDALRDEDFCCPIVLSNRYNGIDLPDDSCRILVIDGLPMGFDDFTKNQETILQGCSIIERNTAERIEQGMGRGVRGSSDYCAVIIVNHELQEWLKTRSHLKYFTNPTHAQFEIGMAINAGIDGHESFAEAVWQVVDGDAEFQKYVSRRTAQIVVKLGEEDTNKDNIAFAEVERRAFDSWIDGDNAKACSKIRAYGENATVDSRLRGFLYQMMAHIMLVASNDSESAMWQRRAHACNRQLPKAAFEPEPSNEWGLQACAAVEQIREVKNHDALNRIIDSWQVNLDPSAAAGKFEEALKEVGLFLGFESQRFDKNGKGPDNVWLLTGHEALVIEAKSMRKGNSVFGKDQYGQLLIGKEWFDEKYPLCSCVLVSIHPTSYCTANSHAHNARVLTLEGIREIASELAELMHEIYDSPLSKSDLIDRCVSLLVSSNLTFEGIKNSRLTSFIVKD